jgi:hypothetical protein
MGLFKHKPEMSIEECCRGFYDSQIFKAETVTDFTKYQADTPDIPRIDFWSHLVASFKNYVAEDDPSFSAVDSDILWREMTALRMAVFGLECSLKVRHKEDLIVRQVLFTKRYLENNGRQDVWDAMKIYNQVIGDSAYTKADGQAVDKKSMWGRRRWVFVNEMRWGMFKGWVDANTGDPDHLTPEEEEKAACLMAALCRVCSDMTRADCIATKLLALTLTERLGCHANLNRKAKFKLGTIVHSFHTGAEGYLKSVTLR